MRTADSESIPIRRSYPKYSAVRGAADYLWKHYDHRVSEISMLARPGFRILEVGCGLAIELHWLALQGAIATGIDVDSFSIKCANALTDFLTSTFNQPLSIDIRRTNVLDLPNTEKFDLIYLKETLHHLEPRDLVFQKLSRLLSPGGSIIVIEPNALNPLIQFEMFCKRGFKTVCEAVDKQSGDPFVYGNERIMSPRTLKRLFKQVGIEGETQLSRLLPTALSNWVALTALAESIERSNLEAWCPPLCIHCVFRGKKNG
jgi:2-polyprenyl-3-methyl-5-hydroxy-6-metoxy-1,4-benzoquinol methylase